MAKNPVIQAAFDKGKKEGYALGLAHGRSEGQAKTILVVAEKLKNLPTIPGVGPKTMDKFIEHFGRKYFG